MFKSKFKTTKKQNPNKNEIIIKTSHTKTWIILFKTTPPVWPLNSRQIINSESLFYTQAFSPLIQESYARVGRKETLNLSILVQSCFSHISQFITRKYLGFAFCIRYFLNCCTLYKRSPTIFRGLTYWYGNSYISCGIIYTTKTIKRKGLILD